MLSEDNTCYPMIIRSDRDVRATGEPARMAIAAMGGHSWYVAQLREAAPLRVQARGLRHPAALWQADVL